MTVETEVFGSLSDGSLKRKSISHTERSLFQLKELSEKHFGVVSERKYSTIINMLYDTIFYGEDRGLLRDFEDFWEEEYGHLINEKIDVVNDTKTENIKSYTIGNKFIERLDKFIGYKSGKFSKLTRAIIFFFYNKYIAKNEFYPQKVKYVEYLEKKGFVLFNHRIEGDLLVFSIKFNDNDIKKLK